MSEPIDPGAVIAVFFAVFMAIMVGIPLGSARTDATLPLMGSCPGQLWNFLTGNGPISVVATTECAVGLVVFLSIPGAIGVGLMAFRATR